MNDVFNTKITLPKLKGECTVELYDEGGKLVKSETQENIVKLRAFERALLGRYKYGPASYLTTQDNLTLSATADPHVINNPYRPGGHLWLNAENAFRYAYLITLAGGEVAADFVDTNKMQLGTNPVSSNSYSVVDRLEPSNSLPYQNWQEPEQAVNDEYIQIVYSFDAGYIVPEFNAIAHSYLTRAQIANPTTAVNTISKCTPIGKAKKRFPRHMHNVVTADTGRISNLDNNLKYCRLYLSNGVQAVLRIYESDTDGHKDYELKNFTGGDWTETASRASQLMVYDDGTNIRCAYLRYRSTYLFEGLKSGTTLTHMTAENNIWSTDNGHQMFMDATHIYSATITFVRRKAIADLSATEERILFTTSLPDPATNGLVKHGNKLYAGAWHVIDISGTTWKDTAYETAPERTRHQYGFGGEEPVNYDNLFANGRSHLINYTGTKLLGVVRTSNNYRDTSPTGTTTVYSMYVEYDTDAHSTGDIEHMNFETALVKLDNTYEKTGLQTMRIVYRWTFV